MMLKSQTFPILSFGAGLLLSLVGIVISSPMLIGAVRSIETAPAELREQLLLGATIFRICLTILGLVIIVLGLLPIWNSNRPEKMAETRSKRSLHLSILGVILLVALALRLYSLNSGLWYDEIVMYAHYMRRPIGEIITTYDFQNQHFLYTLLARGFVEIFGDRVWVLRLPAVLFGVGSVAALYLLGRQVVGERGALLSAALMTVSYHHIWFSQNARGYIGLLFWTILASWLLVRDLEEANSRIWLAYAAAAALGVYTHMTMLFVVAGHFVIYLIALIKRRREAWPDRWAGLLLGFGLAGLLTLQLYAFVLPQVFGNILGSEKEGSAVQAWTNPLWTLLEFIRGLQLSLASGGVAIVAIFVAGVGFLTLLRKNPVIVQLLVIPVLIAASVTIGLGHHVWPRIFFFAIGFGVIVAVYGFMLFGSFVTHLLQLKASRADTIGVALCAALIFVSALSVPFVYGPKQDYEAAMAFVEEQRQPDDAVVLVGLAAVPYRLYYDLDWVEAEDLSDLNAIRSQAEQTWLIYTLSVQLRSLNPEISDTIQSDFELVKKFPGTLGDGTIFVYRSDRAPLEVTAAGGSDPGASDE